MSNLNGWLMGDAMNEETKHVHCWHYALLQHTVTNHRDEICCHCGEKRCLSIPGYDTLGPRLGHGPYVEKSWYA